MKTTNEDISVHDNVLLAYSVDMKRREIKFETKFPFEPQEWTDVIFDGVVAYDFKYNSVSGTIIFNFEPTSPLSIYDACKPQFHEGLRHGWPGEWARSRDSAEAFFVQNRVNAWVLQATMGMCGWILASSIRMERRSGVGMSEKP